MTNKLPVSKELANTISNDFTKNMSSINTTRTYVPSLDDIFRFRVGIAAYSNKFTWDEIIKLMQVLGKIVPLDSKDCAVDFVKEFDKLIKPKVFDGFIKSKEIDRR